MKIAVLGAGISGITISKKLQGKDYEVTVYEKCDKPGGLAKTRIVDGYVYDPHGGHIFNSKHKEIVEWVFSILPKGQWHFSERNAKIFFDGKYISYPFELSLCELDIEKATDCVHDFVLSQQGEEPDNYRDWLVWNFGKAIANDYMLPYNEKIWSYPLENMEINWMQGKMPLPTKKELIRSMLLKNPKERKMPHSTFYYPIDGGIQTMVDAISKTLNIKLKTDIERVEKIHDKWYINGDGPYDDVISTIPLPELVKTMNMPENIKVAIGNLKFNSLTTVMCRCPKTDISWLYVPSRKYKMHRIGYLSPLSPKNGPEGTGSGAFEIIGDKFDFDNSIINNEEYVPKELGLIEALDSEFTEYAYVIHDRDYRKNTTTVKEYFESVEGFNLLGRFATWNYNNMDMCMLDAFRMSEKF